MPDIVLTTLNAKFIHAAFGLRYLFANLGELQPRAVIAEFDINLRPLDIAEKLPPDATLVDAIYELEFRQAVAEGLAELDRGEGIPIEQVKAQIATWAGK